MQAETCQACPDLVAMPQQQSFIWRKSNLVGGISSLHVSVCCIAQAQHQLQPTQQEDLGLPDDMELDGAPGDQEGHEEIWICNRFLCL